MSSAILAIDQGTTGTTCLVVGNDLGVLGRGYAPLGQRFPRPGWVEHDPEEIWRTVEHAAATALADAGLRAAELAGIGIANQRETTLLWERRTGRPVGNAKDRAARRAPATQRFVLKRALRGLRALGIRFRGCPACAN